MFKKFRKHLAALAVAFCGLASFAEGNTFTVDTTAASGAVNTIATAVTGWVTTITPYILGIIGSGIVIWLCFVGWRLIKSGGNKAVKA